MNTRNKLRLIMPAFTTGLIVLIWSIFGHVEFVGLLVYIIIMLLTILTIFYLVRFLQDYKNIEKDKGYRRFSKSNKWDVFELLKKQNLTITYLSISTDQLNKI